jgi:hypothetical protein
VAFNASMLVSSAIVVIALVTLRISADESPNLATVPLVA